MILTLLNDADKSLKVDGSIIERTFRSRILSAVKIFLFWLAFAMGAVFVPVAHFVLVPTFLVLSIVMFVKEFSIRNNFELGSSINCLKCGSSLIFPKALPGNGRLSCRSCYQQYIIII